MELAGQFSTCYLLLSRCGSLVAYLVGIGLPSATADIDYSQNNYWRYMLGFPLVMIAIQTALLLFVFPYETPKFLFFNKRMHECHQALSKVYTNKATMNRVMSKLKALQQDGGKSSEVAWKDLFSSMYLKALIVVLCMTFFALLLLTLLTHIISTALSPRTGWRQRSYLIL